MHIMSCCPHFSRALLVAGIGVLLTSAVSATWALQQPEQAAPRAPDRPAMPAVVALGYVDLEHGIASLAPLQSGRIAEILVRENDRVEAGAALLRLDDTHAR